MLSEKQIEITNKLLSNKVFTYRGPMFSSNWDQLSSNDGVEIDFDYTISLSGYKQMITIGEYMHYLKVDVNIIKLKSDFIKRLNDGDAVKLMIMNSDVKYKLLEEIKDILIIFAGTNVRVLLSSITVDDKTKENIQENIITEKRMSRQAIRDVVRDIVYKVKDKKPGDFYLPENENEVYHFSNLPFDFSVELILKLDTDIEGYKTTAFYSPEDDVIEMIIIFNPNKISKHYYNMVGEINEIIAHELEHAYQEYYGEFDRDYDNEVEDPYKYYTQEHEIPAQLKGFKRLAKLRKQPVEVIAKKWFDEHKDIHGLTGTQIKKVLKKILSYQL
jgi:hypothetical protein